MTILDGFSFWVGKILAEITLWFIAAAVIVFLYWFLVWRRP